MSMIELPPFGSSERAGEFCELMSHGEVPFAPTFALISQMPDLAVEVMVAANSSSISGEMAVERLDRAIVLLGRDALSDIAARRIALCEVESPSSEISAEAYVMHQLAVSIAASMVAQASRLPLQQEARIAGLLHDIGLHVAMIQHGDAFDQAFRASTENGSRLLEHERLLYESDHCELGESYLRARGLPERLCTAVGFHHDPLTAPSEHRYLAAIVYAGECLARRAGFDDLCGERVPPLESKILNELRLDDDVLAAHVPHLQAEMERAGFRELVQA